MTESAADRRRQRMVRHTVEGFDSADNALIFGNTIEKIINDKIGKHKFRRWIDSPETTIAITKNWNGLTTLHTSFMGLIGDEAAQFVCEQMSKTVQIHNNVHRAAIKITDHLVRVKPQPQYIG